MSEDSAGVYGVGIGVQQYVQTLALKPPPFVRSDNGLQGNLVEDTRPPVPTIKTRGCVLDVTT